MKRSKDIFFDIRELELIKEIKKQKDERYKRDYCAYGK